MRYWNEVRLLFPPCSEQNIWLACVDSRGMRIYVQLNQWRQLQRKRGEMIQKQTERERESERERSACVALLFQCGFGLQAEPNLIRPSIPTVWLPHLPAVPPRRCHTHTHTHTPPRTHTPLYSPHPHGPTSLRTLAHTHTHTHTGWSAQKK